MTRILIVYHSQNGNTKIAADLVAKGASSVEGTDVQVKEGLKATIDDLLNCDGIAVGSPDYFSYMAGGLKDFFDRTYYPTKGKVTDKPCGIFLTHGGGGRAIESLKSICGSFKFAVVAEPVLVKGQPDAEAEKRLMSLGKTLAESSAK